jgi:hypothetical protein
MKQLPVPDVPGNTPWERLDNAVRTIFKVPKEAFAKKEARLKKRREKQKQAAKK